MSKYNIEFFNVDKGVPTATIADYGITLNAAASALLSDYKYARIGLDKNRKLVVIAPHNNEEEAQGSIVLRERNEDQQYLRINNKDFLRLVAHQCGISLKPSLRCLAEWDAEENILVIDLNNVLDTQKPGRKRPKMGI